MYRTVKTGTHVLAQGTFVRRHLDGRVEINLGDRHVVGWPVTANPDCAGQQNVIARLFGTGYWRGGLFACLTVLGLGLSFASGVPAYADIPDLAANPVSELCPEYRL